MRLPHGADMLRAAEAVIDQARATLYLQDVDVDRADGRQGLLLGKGRGEEEYEKR